MVSSGLGSPSEPSEAYQLPSLILGVYSAAEHTSGSSRQISETHVKPFLSQSNAEILL